MVLDTNVKKYKYSVWTKIICILLSFITFVAASGLTVTAIFTGAYVARSSDAKEWTQTYYFENMFFNDVNEIVRISSEGQINEDVRSLLESRKESAVEEAYTQYLEQKELIIKEEIGAYYSGYDESTTMLDTDKDISIDVLSDAEKNNKEYPFVDSGKFTILPRDIYYNAGSDDERAKGIIAEEYDMYVNNSMATTRYLDPDSFADSMCYYVEYADNVSSNAEFDVNDVYNKNVYFVFEDGEIKYGGIPEELANRIYDSVFDNDYAKEVNLYLYLSDYPGRHNMISDMHYWNDKYFALQDFSLFALSFKDKLASVIVADVIMAIISFVTAFYYFFITGKKKEDDDAKLYFIDKVPYIIHLGLWAGIAVGAYVLGFNLLYDVISEYSVITMIAMILFAAGCWVFAFEFCASVARYCRSGRKFYNNFILYHIGKLGVKGVKATAKVLSYKPEKFKKNVIIISLLLALGNLAALALIVLFLCINNVFCFVIAILLSLALIGADIYLFINILKYIKNLDRIICCASRREDVAVNLDMEKLPQSLRTLAESMKYTNEELTAAVSKAVRDERLKTELITNVSHDLKTPLTSIITYVDLLSKCDIEDEKAKEYIAVLDEKGGKLKRLIEDLIEASKVTTGNVKVNATSINLYELCLQAVGESQQEFEKVNLDLLVKENEDAPIVFADGAKAFRIMENLLANARKYSAAHTRVYVSVYKEQGMGVFEIKNISAQALDISPDELTQRFVRGDKSRTQDGNGLGLSIAKELCKIQNGRLELSIDGDLFKAKVYLPLSSN